MLDFSNTMNNHHFALNDVELRILQPVFLEFHAKTGLSIDEYGDTRLIPQNLELLINLANDYINLKSATPFPKCYLHKEKWTFDS